MLIATPAFAEKTLIESPAAPKAIGPYSQAIQSGNLVFVSGSLPFDPEGKIDYSKQDVSAQTKRVIDNIALELKAANLTLDDVVSATVYVTDVDDFPAVNTVYASYFHPPFPALAALNHRRDNTLYWQGPKAESGWENCVRLPL